MLAATRRRRSDRTPRLKCPRKATSAAKYGLVKLPGFKLPLFAQVSPIDGLNTNTRAARLNVDA